MANPDTNLKIPGGTVFTDTLLRIYKYNTLNKIYSESKNKHPLTLIDSLLDFFELRIEIPEKDLNNIPLKGPFITVSNQPFSGIDTMILYKLISSKRPDIKMLGSHLLKEIEPLRDIIIPVNTHKNKLYLQSSFSGIRAAFSHLTAGYCLGIVPAAEDSKQYEASGIIIDREWHPTALKLIRNARVPVLPVYFHATLPKLKFLMGIMALYAGHSPLPAELTKKKNRVINVRIGSLVSFKELSEFVDSGTFGRYLRARVYSLGATIKPGGKKRKSKIKQDTVTDSADPAILQEEFNKVKQNYELFTTGSYSVICVPPYVIPIIFKEIGRLRELTFREVGEGTGKSIDIDKYDFYYQHLFIWDNEENRLAGAYRLGKGRDIMMMYGIKGFYINSLFRIKNSFSNILSQSIELGRSFIVKEYQKKPLSLFLLWKGIMVFLLKHPEYRYLIGPVSISNDLSKFSKSLIVEFIRKWFFDQELARHIEPRKEFKPQADRLSDRTIIIDTSEKDINKIEKVITDAEAGYRMPVLLKKYLEINGRIIGFNIDPKFNNCLDGLLILDLYDTPQEFISGLSREMEDPSILERFRSNCKQMQR